MTKTFTFLFAIIGCTLFTLSATAVSAQSIVSASTMDMVPASDLPHGGSAWKAPVDYAAVIATERANTTVLLATPGLKVTGLALYTGYDRMLGYMQADMTDNVPIEEVAAKNFKRVTLETPADPVLQNMQADEFSALYDALIVQLTQQ